MKNTKEKLTSKELEKVKKDLEATREEILKRLEEKKALDMPEAEVGDPMDNASQSMDKEMLFEVSDNALKTVEQIDAAIRRIEKGIYGECESCGCSIMKKRLGAMPFARYCVGCQSTSEQK
ncbi:MAG: TraR/DksA family transcriptional regulator [Elusimicrobiaceae bacterium]|jgi:DnaK suppressor protein|nr:TraR/DksA family transcriptional regulator [Elusimicrobiaceae bacterium]MBT3954981.1 TraR/DksA family transcriptional regulator [Elusimicrobiaceae bacterium]MBT4008127.1 TraR/DksA family transcriptional regulator [Elusimicrobiaceae bacterium]MBT4402677.1 TraR/DksA family transcriptional regulator [Elusimicrobiaceae bacterium]MBT4440039.1 TraR/DksA family transcriptional regulator [Elusimicrobiaceae bacterium]